MKHVYEFTNGRKVTKKEFLRWFEKKFLYTIRKFEMIEKNDKIGYWESNHFRSVVLEDLLKMFVTRAPVKIVKLPKTKETMAQIARKLKIDKIAWGSTTNLKADFIVHKIFKGNLKEQDAKPVMKLGKKNKIIKPLYLFLDKEVLLYAKLKGLKFREVKIKRNKLGKFIDELEKKHPELKHSIVKSYLELF